ncbi:hypothetical protein DTO207G8_6468 [Paecilomyces variotii]|nr:hypothetical protein DTO207G8_6468 [Paecilomyces variotii]KAJ9270760.1 hypothetical protein DTO212C5_3257 [Paecilomyces variotii]
MSVSGSTTSYRAGPLSPSSPAAGSCKATQPLLSGIDHTPQTPTSPPLMSVGSQNYASSFTTTQASPGQTTTSQTAPLSSPPSSTPMSTQLSQQPTVAATNSFPTPASSVSGHLMGTASAEDLENAEKSGARIQGQDSGSMADSMTMGDSGHHRSDHDRQRGGEGKTKLNDSTTVKDEDAMDVDGGAGISRDEGEFSLSSLEKDFGPAFHLCKTSHTMTGPDPSWDLVSLYGLGPIAKSVARTDPVTGEKINRLRKSYEGKLKGLGLAGRNKPVKHDPGAPGGLRDLTMWPEEEWQNQKVSGKEIRVADLDSAFYKLQMKAMKMEPGTVPNHEFWEDALGHEKPPKHPGPGDSKKVSGAATPNAARQPSQPNGTPTATEPERTRPSRGRKRHYDDNSFVGYGEGYVDDDDDALYSNSESGKKRRKKDNIPRGPPPIPERSGSYGVGMFGIGAR